MVCQEENYTLNAIVDLTAPDLSGRLLTYLDTDTYSVVLLLRHGEGYSHYRKQL